MWCRRLCWPWTDDVSEVDASYTEVVWQTACRPCVFDMLVNRHVHMDTRPETHRGVLVESGKGVDGPHAPHLIPNMRWT